MAPPCLVGTLLLLFMVSHTRSGQFHVIGPKAPVIALVGEEAELSCHLSPTMDAQNMEVRWHRNNPFGLVHLYKNFQDHIEKQKPDYGERTEFLKDNITKGDVTLRIRHIRPSDGGEYRCLFESSSYFNEAQFQVLVTGEIEETNVVGTLGSLVWRLTFFNFMSAEWDKINKERDRRPFLGEEGK
ncbi:myelin-oligodendrocyte glycoprotein-like [Dasypus novemcinctus]|uniref:myelin-oligodendrocyte glycoprotein-like n=1 Tax=Dasypus novemcinctus TaxID=9361 RepID=UPI00265DE43B|nr:myelin-oligodendrocyte glycoprotein-like [Dasypus novemcinctus]